MGKNKQDDHNGNYLIISLIFSIVGLLVLFGSVSNVRYLIVTKNYLSTPGRVISFDIQRHSLNLPGRGTTFSRTPLIVYEYSVNDKVYRSQKILATSSLGAPVKSYLPAEIVRVYFNPNNPMDAFLEFPPSNFQIIYLGLILIGFIFLGVGITTVIVYKKRKHQFE